LSLVTIASFRSDSEGHRVGVNIALLFASAIFVVSALGCIGSWMQASIQLAKAAKELGPPPVAPESRQRAPNTHLRQARQPTPEEMIRVINARGNTDGEPEFPA
jgi:hypothetical protein